MIPINSFKNIRAFGSSMEPLLKENDIVYLKKRPFRSIKVNDIVAVKKYSKIITHRVIYKTNSFIITKGDNNLQSDGKIHKKNIVGLVTNIKRGGLFFKPDDLYFFQSTLYFREILKIKQAFEKHHIPYVFLKGLPLYLFLQKTHPRRIYGDCDILIKEKDIKTVFSIFHSYGYRYISAQRPWVQFLPTSNSVKKFNFYKQIGDFFIVFDIHTSITFMIDHLGHLGNLFPEKKLKELSAEFLEKKQYINIQNEKFPTLSYDHLAVYLSLHIFNHNYELPFRYELLFHIMKKNLADYKNIKKYIMDYGLENYAYPSFFFLKKFFYPPLPLSLLKDIRPKKNFYAYIKNHVFEKNIFERKSLIQTGVERFLYSFFLSPEPVYKKMLVFLDVRIISTIIWIVAKKISNTLFHNSLFFQNRNKA